MTDQAVIWRDKAKESGQGTHPVYLGHALRCGFCGHISNAHYPNDGQDGLPKGERRCAICWLGCPAQAVSQRKPTRTSFQEGHRGLQPLAPQRPKRGR